MPGLGASSKIFERISLPKDKFELHLQNLIEAEYGAGYCSQYLKMSFPNIDDEEICMVEISRGDKQLYTNITDKHGQKNQKFFIRRGNASVELSSHSEVIEYIENRFNKNL